MEVLFEKGLSRNAYPIKLVSITSKEEMSFPAQAMFVVPKRNFKRSPDRNTLKRRMRESYRLRKHSLYTSLETANKKLLLAFIYVGKGKVDYAKIDASIQKLISEL